MTKNILHVLYLMLIIQSISTALAGDSELLVLNYGILSEGNDIGDITLKLIRNNKGHVIAQHRRIKTSGWWGKINISSYRVEQFSADNDLLLADNKIQDGDTTHWIKIEAHQHVLSGSYRIIKGLSAQEKQELADLLVVISSESNAEIERIVSLSGALFADRKIASQDRQFKKNDFDATFNSLAFFIQKSAGKQLPEVLRLLDTENMEIIRQRLDDLGTEVMTIGTKSISTRHIKLSDSSYKPSHIWIADSPTSLPFIIRHTGEDEDGEFDVILKPE